jgi:NADH:ubiquinone oxidoreductase subunit 5 (subunit L)/multisubunit Na+/H+ antiporter MnhA subunit
MIALLLVVLPLAAGVGLLGAGRAANRVAAPVAVAAAVGSVVLAAIGAATRPAVSVPLFAGSPAGLRIDGLSAVLALTVAAVTLAVLVYAAGELSADPGRWRFFGLLLVFAGAMLVTVTATTLPVLLAAWEVMGATSYALIGFWHADLDRVRGGEVAFLTTRTADVGLYLAAGGAVAAGVPGLRLAGLAAAPGGWRDLVAAGVVLAALGKSAQLPFSFWLSRAMAGPSPVSALLHSATMVAAGGYLLLRLHPLLAATSWAAPLVAWLGAATALVLGAVAVAQRDLKQLLAASTCAQLGYLVLAAGVSTVAGGAQQFVAHAATKSLLFLCAGAWLTGLGTKQLPGLAGAARRYPLVGVVFTVGAVSLAGVPPLSIWAAKDEIVAGASTPLYAVGLAATLLGAAYAGKAVAAVWRRGPGDRAYREQPGAPVTRSMRAALVPLAAGAAGLATLSLPPVAAAWRRLLGVPGEAGPTAAELVLSGAIAAAAFAGVVALQGVSSRRARSSPAGPPTRRARSTPGGPVTSGARPGGSVAAANRMLVDWLWLERAAVLLVARPVLRLARALATVDDRLVDGGVRVAARSAAVLSTVAGAVVELRVDTAVRSLAAGVRRLGAWARLPQTGQLHQYYAQALVGLAVLIVLLIVFGSR